MASAPEPSAQPDAARKNSTPDKSAKGTETTKVAVGDLETQETKKKKRSKRSAGARKRGTGFEGMFGTDCPQASML